MSRVDEALRRARAAGNDAAAPVGLPEPANLGADDPLDLPLEPMPSERHHRSRSSAPALPLHGASPGIAQKEAQRAASSARQTVTQLLPSLVERIDRALSQKIVVDARMLASSREQYRRLAASLHHTQSASGLKVIMIVSAAPGEGKTLTAANLGLTFSESYKRSVLLIDADLRRPALHKVFGTDNASGLTEGLMAATERKLPVRQVSERLSLLQAGQPNSDPMAGLTSERMLRLITEAREAFDWVIIDSPPVALLPDANLLGAMVDGALMVVKAGSTSYELVQRAVDAIGRHRILGVVLNRANATSHGYGYEYYQTYYGARPEELSGS
jgi:capsular exopolysaccharide synthesis family protein